MMVIMALVIVLTAVGCSGSSNPYAGDWYVDGIVDEAHIELQKNGKWTAFSAAEEGGKELASGTVEKVEDRERLNFFIEDLKVAIGYLNDNGSMKVHGCKHEWVFEDDVIMYKKNDSAKQPGKPELENGQQPFFDENGLTPNMKAGEELTVLDNGTFSATMYDDVYLRGETGWKVEILRSGEMVDGRKNVTFRVSGGVLPHEEDGYYYGGNGFTVFPYLCDRYTGLVFPEDVTDEDVDGEENQHHFSLKIGSETYDIQYSVDIDWERGEERWTEIMYKTVNVIYPASYDGLMFCALQMPEAKEDFELIKGENRNFEAPAVMSREFLEAAKNGLICSIG